MESRNPRTNRSSAFHSNRARELDEVALGLLLDLAYEPPPEVVHLAIQAFASKCTTSADEPCSAA